MADTITIEVAFALAEQQTLLALSVAKGTSVLEAIELSDILLQYPAINLSLNPIGIFGKRIVNPQAYELMEGDRIEIYRPLLADPKEARRHRAEQAAAKKV